MRKNNIKTKTLSMSLKSLAFALGLVATANTTTLAMPIKEETKTESHDHNHESEHELELNEVVVKLEKNYTIENQKVFKQIAIKEIKNYSITNYKGSSIVEALNLCGIDHSFSNRKLIAANYGIKNYRGTASQNIMLLNMLKTSNVSSIAKVSDINQVCTSLFGKDANKIIKDLNLPKTNNITKSDFARIIRKIATYMNVDTTTYDNKLNQVINVIGDIDSKTINNNDIAWAYYMGYVDVDSNSNYNGNNLLSVNELNNWINSFVYDYNFAVSNNKINNNGLVITPSQDKYQRDNLDSSKINGIRNPKLNNSVENNTNKGSNNNHGHDHGNKPEQHKHNFSGWQYYDENNEINTCNSCGEKRYRTHSLNGSEKIYSKNNDGTHNVTENANCNTCGHEITKRYNADCNLSEWTYNNTTNLDERECNLCGYEETRTHVHSEEPSDLQYSANSNDDGTHTLTAVYNCSICNKPITLNKEESCNFTEWSYNFSTKLDERECDVCGYDETRTHVHSEEPSDLEYDIYQSNNNGTHKLIAIYDCSICNQEVTLYKDADCKYGEWIKKDEFSCKKECECGYILTKSHDFETVAGTVQKNDTIGTHNETQECICGATKSVEVDCTSDGKVEYYRVGNTVTEVEHCSVCLDVCVNDTHTHDFGDNYIKPEGISDYHTRECVCGEIDTAVHNFTDWVVNSEGKNTRECTECGYGEEKDHQCIKNAAWEPTDETIIGPCYDMVKTCTYEGCDYEFERQGYDHNYTAEEYPEFGIIYYYCKCGADYEEEIPQVLSLRNTLELTDEDDVYKEDLEETTDETKETEVIEEVNTEEKHDEEELEEIEEIKDLEPIEETKEETDNKVLVLK